VGLKKLVDLQLFQDFAETRPSVKSDMVLDDLTETRSVKADQIDDQLAVIRRRFKFASRNRVLADFERGAVVPIFDEALAVPLFIPAWLIYKSGQVVALVNLSLYARRAAEGGALELDNRKMFGLLQSGSTLLALFENLNRVTNSMPVVKPAAYAYTRMLCRVLDKAYSLHMNRVHADQAAYLVALWFLTSCCSRPDNESTRGLAMGCVAGDTSPAIVRRVEEHIGEDGIPAALNEFVELLAVSTETLRHATVRGIVESWMTTYGEGTLLAIESLQYFLATIFGVATNAGLCNESVVNQLAGSQLVDCHSEFFRLVR